METSRWLCKLISRSLLRLAIGSGLSPESGIGLPGWWTVSGRWLSLLRLPVTRHRLVVR